MAKISDPSLILPLLEIQKNIHVQLGMAQQIFMLVQKIANLARDTNDSAVKASLGEIMGELLKTGKELSTEATAMGNHVINLMNMLDQQVKSETAQGG
ncbi:MAG TPA: hypothetical protein VFP72_15265 [Kineosporiaceae bacterium]|nr:hypothetical protein [Kineosporiaceae bacterium]